MAINYSVNFRWNGKLRTFRGQAQFAPKDALDAHPIAYTSCRKWFKDRNLSIPDSVRNVEIDTPTSSNPCVRFEWDLIDLTD